MDFVIKNNKNVYIRLSENGKAETCKEKDMGRFTEQKAKNILKSLPKTLKNLNFRIECIPDIKMETPIQKIVKEESKKLSKTQIINLLTILRNGLKNLVHVRIFLKKQEKDILNWKMNYTLLMRL